MFLSLFLFVFLNCGKYSALITTQMVTLFLVFPIIRGNSLVHFFFKMFENHGFSVDLFSIFVCVSLMCIENCLLINENTISVSVNCSTIFRNLVFHIIFSLQSPPSQSTLWKADSQQHFKHKKREIELKISNCCKYSLSS